MRMCECANVCRRVYVCACVCEHEYVCERRSMGVGGVVCEQGGGGGE